MAKNSREGNQTRNKRYREALAERGIRPVQVLAPESAHLLIRQAANLMTRDGDPMEPRAAMRAAGGANEPELDGASVKLLAELEAARSRIAVVELDTEKRRAEIEAIERHMKALQTERDAAMRGQVTEREKAQLAVTEAQKRTLETLQRAEKAEAAIRQAKTMPGIRGRLVRWLAGDVLPD
jgi:chromosome segregation ATPase